MGFYVCLLKEFTEKGNDQSSRTGVSQWHIIVRIQNWQFHDFVSLLT